MLIFLGLVRGGFYGDRNVAGWLAVAVDRRGGGEGQDVGGPIFAAKLAVEAADVVVAGQEDGNFSLEADRPGCVGYKGGEGPSPQGAAESDLYRGVDDDHGRVRQDLRIGPAHETPREGLHPPRLMVPLMGFPAPGSYFVRRLIAESKEAGLRIRDFRSAGYPAAVCRQAGFEVPIAAPAPDIFILTSFSCHV